MMFMRNNGAVRLALAVLTVLALALLQVLAQPAVGPCVWLVDDSSNRFAILNVASGNVTLLGSAPFDTENRWFMAVNGLRNLAYLVGTTGASKQNVSLVTVRINTGKVMHDVAWDSSDLSLPTNLGYSLEAQRLIATLLRDPSTDSALVEIDPSSGNYSVLASSLVSRPQCGIDVHDEAALEPILQRDLLSSSCDGNTSVLIVDTTGHRAVRTLPALTSPFTFASALLPDPADPRVLYAEVLQLTTRIYTLVAILVQPDDSSLTVKTLATLSSGAARSRALVNADGEPVLVRALVDGRLELVSCRSGQQRPLSVSRSVQPNLLRPAPMHMCF